MMWARTRGEGTHKGCPYGWMMWAHTRGEGTHKGCPYGWMMWARRAARLIFLWLRRIIVVDLVIHSSQVLGFVGWTGGAGQGFGGFGLRQVSKEMEAAAARIGGGL